MRYFFFISYKGTNYHGWQAQPNANTVQEEINIALKTIFQNSIETLGSGRTDTGVHAKEQVFHADLPEEISPGTLIHKLNGVLPNDIVVNAIHKVKEEAHARFDAISRSYEYHIQFSKSPFKENEYHFLPSAPDFDLMNKACKFLTGTHDFTSFSKVKTEVNNFNCTITRAEWVKEGDGVTFHISANRFLRGMVRAIVGTLLNVGNNKISLEEFNKIIEAKDRTKAGQAVPARGLYLCEVRYPKEVFI
ncbi:MAG: tRNA pseudouridine(38-40) synthase TruA [Bacteroidota bacterium]